MHYTVTKKIQGGKLLRLKIEAAETIQKINITGDFFLHPEEALPEIEKALIGLSIQSTPQQLAEKIEEVLQRQNATFIGVTATDIAQILNETLQSKSSNH